jgi:LmbE family N-acetylglucosaminyl deacetylase
MRPKFLATVGAAALAVGLTPLAAVAAPMPDAPVQPTAGTAPAAGTAAALTDASGSGKMKFGDASQSSKKDPTKLDVLGIWAHPDDDASLTTPCGIWHDRHDLKCGIMLTTRGEGGSNSVGDEAGPDLAKRRENEDRTSHTRMGTDDIYYLDRVDFFYNTSAPLTQKVWDHEETLRRAVRVVRETRPEILTTWTPSLAAGHGNHQEAGRLTWEVARAAADPKKFPEQLTGENAVKTWQIKRILEMPNVDGKGAKNQKNCLADFTSADTNPYPVVGLWTGYTSPYTWAKSNTAGVKAGTRKTWAQVGTEGAKMHATQARTMQKDEVDSSCLKWSVPFSSAPMQSESVAAGRNDDSALYGAAVKDPGGMPLGSLFYAEPDQYRVGSGESTKVTVHAASGKGTLKGGTVSLKAPKGWSVSDPQQLSDIPAGGRDLTFTVTAPENAASTPARIQVSFKGSGVSAYNGTTVLPVDGVEGRFQRWGNTAEYDEWTDKNAAYSGGPSQAYRSIGAGESVTVPITVTNHTSETASGSVKVTAPDGISVTKPEADFDGLAAAQSTTEKFVVTHTDPKAAGGDTKELTVTTTSGGKTSTEKVSLEVVPSAEIAQLKSAPKIDGVDDGYSSTLDLSKVWEGDKCDPDGTDCGKGSNAKVGWYDDSLYALITVKDEQASAAATPRRCFGHWLVDSTEILLDPHGDSDDTSTTFKLGVFPFTDDAKNYNGNGVNGPCWERDADFHQGFATGPLADTVLDAPNAPGVKVAAKAQRNAKGSYADGKWTVEVKIPLEDLPQSLTAPSKAPTGSADTNQVDPEYLGLNISPYDSDTQDFIGQTRLAWSAFGSQQSEPYRWGHAYLKGYTAPASAAAATKAATGDPIIPNTALSGADSPQTIYQSAQRGVPIAGLTPASGATVRASAASNGVNLDLGGPDGTFHAYLQKGDPTHLPVWTSSCADKSGYDACSASDGKAAPWGKDMAGTILAEATAKTSDGKLTLKASPAVLSKLGKNARILVSFRSSADVEGKAGSTDAWVIPVTSSGSSPTSTAPSSTAPGSTDPGTTSPSDTNPSTAGPSGTAGAGHTPSGSDNAGTPTNAGDHLSNTGANVMWAVIIVVVLIVLGLVAVVVGRRRRHG